MIKLVITLAIILGSSIFSIIKPLYLPQEMVDALTQFLFPVWQWNGIFPIEAIYNSISAVFVLLTYYFVFRFVFWFVGTLTGTSAPKV